MERIDRLLSGGVVVTMNATFDVFYDGAVAIHGAQIVGVGPREAIEARYQADEVIDCRGTVVMPGLVNAHTHAPMTLLRGLADDLRLDVWLLAYVMPVEREFVTPEFCRLGTALACAEMIRSGITCFADMYYFEDEIAAMAAEIGVRGVLGQTVLQFPAPDAETYDDGLARARRFIEDWRGHPLITPSVAPHAPYTNPDSVMQRCAQLAREMGVPLLTHIAETRPEVDNSLAETGKPVVQRMHEIGLFEADVLAAHCVHITPAEMRLLQQGGATVAHNPGSNLKLASGIAPVTQMLRSHLTVGIGTDGAASNNDLDMFEEVRLTAILAKTQANDPTAVPARQALLMATRQGAEALFLGDVTGSLEPGKYADVIVMESRTLHNWPQFERDDQAVYSQIVYTGHASDVRDVFCHGRMLMRERHLLTVDEAAVMAEAEAYARRVDAFMAEREASVLSRLVAVNELRRSESFEVQVKARVSSAEVVDRLLAHPDVEVIKQVHYRQYDTYFMFDTPEQVRLRYREDDLLVDAAGTVGSVRARLTLSEQRKERGFHSGILLSRSRYIADASRPLRFYREYFRPSGELELQKDRRRWHIYYRNVLFYVNLDEVLKPALPGLYLEIKSTTWSLHDAEFKADLIRDMLQAIGITEAALVRAEYADISAEQG